MYSFKRQLFAGNNLRIDSNAWVHHLIQSLMKCFGSQLKNLLDIQRRKSERIKIACNKILSLLPTQKGVIMSLFSFSSPLFLDRQWPI